VGSGDDASDWIWDHQLNRVGSVWYHDLCADGTLDQDDPCFYGSGVEDGRTEEVVQGGLDNCHAECSGVWRVFFGGNFGERLADEADVVQGWSVFDDWNFVRIAIFMEKYRYGILWRCMVVEERREVL